jgi:hypothetical protein
VTDILFSTESLNPFLIRNQCDIVFGKQNNRDFKNIVDIELVDSVPTRCIEVDSDTHTFLYGHTFSITHNTNKEFNYFSKYVTANWMINFGIACTACFAWAFISGLISVKSILRFIKYK